MQQQRKIYRLHESLIAGIARMIQEAILTGTDISDHFRMIKVEPKRDDPEALVFTPEFAESIEKNIQRMLDNVEKLKGEQN